MNEILLEARDELKRLEHIIYVSLKYTRTVDVITNALNRMVSTYDLVVDAFLEKAQEEGKIDVLPKSPALRARRLAEIYEHDQELQKYLKFYTFLKTILTLPYERRQEYRRHVTRIVALENATAELCIDNLTNAEKYLHKFLMYAWHTIVGMPEEDD
ncbi:hypothetical protein COV12_02760 [Candidatus Woesearchaeota archaeon CG10_big_fil_rev_8_21_14_0_10_32_24]|nr:MAG: hypothetical protein COV12_02760 [Candidatus Woesearchaeota archaeon CG10_big_fil_rev_8_21_14_0_10_32_24]